jgi:enoyl-CoA hydratase/carnithine racemase
MKFAEYSHRYQTVKMERQDGILLLTLHTNDGPLEWGALPHAELPAAFHDVGSDLDNRVIILTGTGDAFSGPRPAAAARQGRSTRDWDRIIREGKALLANLLSIEAPMIGAINGPALRHSELPLLCDIVLASDNATLEDAGHFDSGFVPGDGVNIVYPILLGLNRARYFLLTSQSLSAREALNLGLVNEVLPRERLLERAFEHARRLAGHPDLHLRHTRLVLTEYLKRQLQTYLGHSLALEALANIDRGREQPGQ